MLDYFHIPQVDQEEFLTVLLEHFGRSGFQGNRIRFQRGDDQEHYLDVVLNDDNRIVGIDLSPGAAAEQEAIRDKIEHFLIANQYPAIGQRVGYCHRRVTGCFRYREEFQMLPVPPEAPRPQVLAADHPFLLQYSYVASTNTSVKHLRADRKAKQYLRLLNVLSDTRIHAGPRYAWSYWVLHDDPDPARWTCAWEQRGYTYQGYSGLIEEYSDLQQFEPIALLTTGDNDLRHRTMGGEAFTLPQDIGALLDTAVQLGPDQRERFSRASAYFDLAETVRMDSDSLSYIALVTALESLMSEPERCRECNQPATDAVETCGTCGRPRYHVMRRFREFLEECAPFTRDLPWARNLLYGVRSDLAHGRDVMYRDLHPLALFNTRAMSEDALQRALHRIAATAIRNWLRSQAVPT